MNQRPTHTWKSTFLLFRWLSTLSEYRIDTSLPRYESIESKVISTWIDGRMNKMMSALPASELLVRDTVLGVSLAFLLGT